MEIQSFIANFEDAIDDTPEGSITAETEFQQLPQWDSLAFLSLLAMLDLEYGVEADGTRILSCQTIEELFAIVSETK